MKLKQFLIIWSEKRFLPFKLYTTYLQEKSNYKKSYAYLTYSQYSTCLLKKYPYLQHSSESKVLQACKMPDVFFWLIFLVSSPPPMTNFHILHPQTLLLEHIFIRHKWLWKVILFTWRSHCSQPWDLKQISKIVLFTWRFDYSNFQDHSKIPLQMCKW